MKCFIITLLDRVESVRLALVALESATNLGYEATLFKAHDKRTGPAFLYNNRVRQCSKFPFWSRHLGELGCFASHFALWETCIELQEPIIILEHDAVMLRRWDDFSWEDILHLDYEGSAKRRHYVGKRDDLIVKDVFGPITENSVFKMNYVAFDQPWTPSMPCAHAYAVQPDAARRLIEAARAEGWYATDRFMCEPIVNIDTVHPKIAEEQPEAMHIWTTSEN